MNKHYKNVKQLIRKDLMINDFNYSKYAFSPYMACEHGCVYCDGRAERYYVEGEFENDIIIRKNAPDLLKIELPKLREKGLISIGSGISDSYQPVEAEEKIMRQCAEILSEYNFPVTIITKSNLILRDIDIWKKIHLKNGFIFMVTVTFIDDELRKIFEPKASSIPERLNMIRIFKNENIPVGVLAMPLLPFISDTSAHIEQLLKTLKDCGVDFVCPSGLTIRPGRQKDFYMDTVKKYFPHLEKNMNGFIVKTENQGCLM